MTITTSILAESATARLLEPTRLLDYKHPSLASLIERRGWRALPVNAWT
jgi:hypothetical protein